jgi:hypothetical protein
MADAAPPAPPISAPPAGEPAQTFDIAGSDAFGALDAIGSDVPDDQAPPAPPEKPTTPPKGPDGRFQKKPDEPKPKPAAKPDEKKGAPKPPEIDFDKPPEKAADLRKHYDALKVEAAARAEKVATYEKRIAELEKATKTPQEWPEKKTYEERLAEHQKKLAAYEEEMRYSNYAKSEEYKDKFEKPYVNAYTAGRKAATGLKVIERKDETTGATTQASRQGTAEDFDAIMRARDPETAADLASKLFGDARAPMVLYHVEAAKQRAEEAETAISEYREKGKKWEAERQEKVSGYQKRATEMVEGFVNAAIEKFPQYFKPDADDPKGNELLEKGQHLVARVIANGAPLADGETQMSGEDMAKAIAAFRTKAGAFDRLFYKFRSQSKELAEVKKALKQYEESTPGDGEGGRKTSGEKGADSDDPFTQLDAMAKEVPGT